ncbi:MAG: PLP-dependent aminotransferase family protein [Ilumatobacteraceae bacterium]
MTTRFASRMNHVKPSAIRDLLRFGADPSIISFGGGYPDATLFPLEQLDAVFSRSILQHGRDTLQYTVSNGPPHLRAQIAARMANEGVVCTEDNILILQGGQQGLDLVAKLLVDKGDVIITEDPTFLGGLIAFNPCEPTYRCVGMDNEGMDTDALERVLATHPGTKFIYTIPDFQNPTGVTMSVRRRRHVVELANRYDVIILEDGPYRETRFEGASPPTIKSFDTEGRVIYLGSFSKILAPGLRLGWAIASVEIIEQLGLLKLAADTQCSTLNMAAVSLYLDSYDIDSHIDTIRQVYRHKKDLMLDTIRAQFPDDVTFTDPQGGLFTWLTFPEGFDTEVFMRDHALPQAKVAYVPGATFFPLIAESNHARLSYSTQSDERIVEGIARLGSALKAAMVASPA